MRQVFVPRDDLQPGTIPWALRMKAVSGENPIRLVKSITGAILSSGGWILRRCASNRGRIDIIFEFERYACLEVYSTLIAIGLEFSQGAHRCFTEVCQCTRFAVTDCADEIVSVELQVQTSPSAIDGATAIQQ